MQAIDILTLIAFLALNIDIVSQIIRVRNTRSSKDLSLFGMSVRFFAIIIILLKYIAVSDPILLTGQVVILLIFSTYFVHAILYRKRK